MDTVITKLLMEAPAGKPNRALREYISNQPTFDALFELLFHHERTLVLRAADAVERITVKHQEYLRAHKADLFRLFTTSDHTELRPHLAKLITRVTLAQEELDQVWNILQYWARNPNESKPVRARALQSLYDFARMFPQRNEQLHEIVAAVKHEPIQSLRRVVDRILEEARL